MKLSLLPLPLLLVASCSATSSSDDAPDYGDDPMSNPAFLEAMQAFATPTEAHAELAKGVGFWTVSGQATMHPGADPMAMEGTANVRTLLGGRYIMQEYKSEFMGQPFEGLMIMGHNNATEEYFSMWLDTMGTAYSDSAGRENEGGDIEMSGMVRDALNPDGRPFRTVTHQISSVEFRLDMFDTLPDGTEWKVMEMTYKRY